MIGIPGQTIEILQDTISEVLQLNPEHISVYSLIVEPGTKIEKLLKRKKFELPSDEEEREMYWLVNEKLTEKGYIHYEISNYAKQGYQSKHNVDCWEQKEYLGFGVAAHSYMDMQRYSNTTSIEQYLNENNNYIVNEIQNKKMQMDEYMMLGLRKIAGINITNFKNKFMENPLTVYKDVLDKLEKEELIKVDMQSISLTKKGIDLANLVWEEFV